MGLEVLSWRMDCSGASFGGLKPTLRLLVVT